jgi:hypothetical protein
MRELFVRGGTATAALVIASRELSFSWDGYAEGQLFEGLSLSAANRRVELFDFTDGVHRRTHYSAA